MKQVIGSKKHNLCQEIADKKYIVCYTSGKYQHYVAECWIDERNADYVNYKIRHVWPKIRNGQSVEPQ